MKLKKIFSERIGPNTLATRENRAISKEKTEALPSNRNRDAETGDLVPSSFFIFDDLAVFGGVRTHFLRTKCERGIAKRGDIWYND